MYEVIFLFVLALLWIIFATVQDLKKREIANWLNFSLIIFVLGFRFFYSLFSQGNFEFFYQGLIGLGIFFIIGNLFYYGRLFAGGDAKMMIALGAVLPFSENFSVNMNIFILFLFLFFIVAAIYSLIVSLVLSFRNFGKFRKEFYKRWKLYAKPSLLVMILGIIIMILNFEIFGIILGSMVFISPLLMIYAKAVVESCMVKKIKTTRLTEGDWLYRNLKIGKRLIKPSWGGLNKKDIGLIRRNKKFVLIKQGIPFTPVFLFSFLIFFYFWKTGLWNSLW